MGIVFGVLGIAAIVFGVALILTRDWSAELHERWNQKFRWTRWATGPEAMRASRTANMVFGTLLISIGAGFLVLGFVFYLAGS